MLMFLAAAAFPASYPIPAVARLMAPAPLQYTFPTSGSESASVDITFEGDIPILGGQQGKAAASAVFNVDFASPVDGKAKIIESLTQFKVNFNGFDLPLTLNDALKYFPKSSFLVGADGTYQGLTKTAITPPVRLPGLSVENVPRISFAPFQLPAGLAAVGDKADYDEPVPGGKQTVELTVASRTDDAVTLTVAYHSTTSGLEDSAQMVTTDPKSAANKVSTSDAGTGKAVFSLTKGMFTSVDLNDMAVTDVTAIDTGKKSQRRLARGVKIVLGKAKVEGKSANPKSDGKTGMTPPSG